MRLYHGSNTGDIKVLEPRQADHDRSYVYMTTIDVVAAFYLCNAVEKPYYWFPYGFDKNSDVPTYHELYPDALKQVSQGVSGYIYEVAAEVVSKRINVAHHRHANAGDMTGAHGYHTTSSTRYYVTFQVESGDRMELSVSGSEYGMLADGDRGRLSFQGTRYLSFERS